MDSVTYEFTNGDYDMNYCAEHSFTASENIVVNYADTGIINWQGTDCSLVDGLSIFTPVAGKRYNILFYFDGLHFVGAVSGFIPATVENAPAEVTEE